MSLKSSEKGDKREDEVKSSSIENVEIGENPLKTMEQDELKDLILNLQKQINDIKTEKVSFEDQEEYDVVNDYLEVPAVFFVFSFDWACHGDVRRGRKTYPPLGKFIKFKKLYRYKRLNTGGRGSDVVSVAQATVRSKSEAEWLREHSLFNIKFFENINDAKSVDTTLAEKMSEMQAVVANMNDMAVIQRCKAMEIRVHSDLDTLRRELVQTMAKNDLRKTQQTIENHLKAERDDNDRVVEYRTAEGEVTKEQRDASSENVY